VAKCCFGGLGKNFINPALAGRCFLLISFGRIMNTFAVDGISSATPTANLAAGKAVNLTSMFLGTSNAVIGSSILALLVGGLVLWSMDIIHGQICFSVLGGFTLFIALFGVGGDALRQGQVFFQDLSLFYPVFGISIVLQSVLEGVGDISFCSVIGVASLAQRIALSYALRPVFAERTIAIAEGIVWATTLLIFAVRMALRKDEA